MPSKKSSNDVAAQIKKDMVNYIGPIFQELKSEIKDVRGEIKRVESSLKGETHRLGILMEDMRKEVITALEASSSVLQHEDIAKDHGERIQILERDVGVLKAVRSPKP